MGVGACLDLSLVDLEPLGLHALRESNLGHLPRELFNLVLLRSPGPDLHEEKINPPRRLR